MIQGTIVSSILMALEFVVLMYILLYSIRLKRMHPVTRMFYILWIATLFTSNLYYFVHSLQNKGLYLPFSVMDIVDAGIYVLLGAVLQYNFSIDIKKVTWPAVSAAIFGAINVWLWIIWSGTYFGNLINGIPFMFLLAMCARSFEESHAMTRTERICFESATITVSAIESVLYFTKGTLYIVLDTCGYVLMFACLIFLIFKTIDSLRTKRADKALALSACAYTMGLTTLYLSYEPLYFIAEALIILAIVLTYLAIREKEREASEQ